MSRAGMIAPRRLAPPVISAEARVAGLIVALVLLAPLPLGAHRPLAWTVIAALTGAIGVLFMLTLRQRVRLGWLWVALALAATQPLWGLMQALPLSALANRAALPVALPPEAAAVLRPQTLSLAPHASLLAALRMAGNIGFFLLALAAMRAPKLQLRSLRWVFGAVAGYAVFAMISLVLMGDTGAIFRKTAYHGYATGPFVNRNAFASFLGMGLICGVALLQHALAQTPLRRARGVNAAALTLLAHLLLIALILIALLATGSRMGLAASLAGAALTFGLMRRAAPPPANPRPPSARRRATGAALGMAMAGLAGAVLLFGQATLERSLFTSADSATRLGIYADTLHLIATRPLSGYGLDSFPLAYELARSEAHFDRFTYADAHSTYLENWAEGGLVFGSAPLIAAAIVLARLWANYRRQPGHATAPAVALGALTLAGLHALIDFSFEIEANLLLLLLLLAIGATPPLQPRRDQP